MHISNKWKDDYVLWVEVFVLVNLGFLSVDIYLAHSENAFRYRPEWIPLFFSAIAPVILLVGLLCQQSWNRPRLWRSLGYLVGITAILVGITGVVYHLDSTFFYERTIRSLTYAAPFVAPLAYTGLGLLLILNRMVPGESLEWAQWVLLLALAGFFGNFVLSVTDHAQNGFFRWTEWIPVVSSALAVSFLVTPLVRTVTGRYLLICVAIMLLQAAVGVLGFIYHALADIHGASKSLFENVVSGAPPMAPLLFPNLVLLALIALWAFSRRSDNISIELGPKLQKSPPENTVHPGN